MNWDEVFEESEKSNNKEIILTAEAWRELLDLWDAEVNV